MKSAQTRVSPYVRWLLGIFAVRAVWQVVWLIADDGRLEQLLPAFLNVPLWIVTWISVALTTGVGAVTGRDVAVRVGFGVGAVTSTMAAFTLLVDKTPMAMQFWSFGQAVNITALCFIFLLSPLRIPPHRFEDGFPT